MAKFLVFSLALTLGQFSQALDLSATGGVITGEVNEQPDAEYEVHRKYMADHAATYEEFLQWATPTEIAADLGMDPNDFSDLIEKSSDQGDYAVRITVHLSSQTMEMSAPNGQSLRSRVATGRPGYGTPTLCRHPVRLEKNHWSRKYKAPMPNSVFFTSGMALHTGSVNIRSHGCVHLPSSVSLAVYNTVREYSNSTMICIVR